MVDLHAERGEDVLRSIVETDENSCRLGEVALVPFDSPIRNHRRAVLQHAVRRERELPPGAGDRVRGVLRGRLRHDRRRTVQRAASTRARRTSEFMIGTDNLNIDGIKADGERVAIFRNGNWAF